MNSKVVKIVAAIVLSACISIMSFNFLAYNGDSDIISSQYFLTTSQNHRNKNSTSVQSVTKNISNTANNSNVNTNVPGAQGGQNGQGGSGGSSGPANNKGEEVVQEALKYVGNPYVWGGDSLTNGCDCSGFVVQIYKLFGVDLSASRQSSLLRSVGNAVSRNDMLPGDIVCYSGHVAIYAGNGKIVEAQSSRAGITSNRSVDNKPILAIRRVLNY